MVKTKERKKSGFTEISNSNFDLDLHGDDSWVIVKKQKVTVLVPPPPTPKVLPGSDPEKSQPGPQFQTPPANIRSENSNWTCLEMPPATQDQQKGLVLALKKGTRHSRKAPPQHFLTLAKSLRQDGSIQPTKPNRDGTLKSQNAAIHVCNASKFIEQSLNQRLRALNLERKLQQAGGLSRWLASLGLDQFVRIFQRRCIGKFHLVNMTMKKLKDMGANAVGPRRKLMHAIDCICQPNCFESLYSFNSNASKG